MKVKYRTKITSRLIFVLNASGGVDKIFAPNHIGRTVPELLKIAEKRAAEIGGTVRTKNL